MVLFTEYIGLYLAAGIYLAVYMRWIGKHRWVTVLILSINSRWRVISSSTKCFSSRCRKESLMGWLPF